MRAARAAWNLFLCSHPEPVLAVTAAIAVLALSAGRGWTTIWAVTAVFSGHLFVGWSNDYFDADLDRLAGRTDKPIVAGLLPAKLVRNAAAVALAACVPLSLANGIAAGAIHLFAVALATAYNVRLKASLLSALPYLLAFALVPAFITLGLQPARLPPLWATLGAGLLGAGAHFSQVLPDIAADRRLGVFGLPQALGARTSTLVAALLLAASGLVILLGPGRQSELELGALVLTLLIVGSIVAAGLAGAYRLAFRLTLVAAAGVAGIFLLSGGSLGQ